MFSSYMHERPRIYAGEGGYPDPLGRVFVTGTLCENEHEEEAGRFRSGLFPLNSCDYGDQEFNEISLRESDES
jgi:hypothetical protein